MFDGLQVHGGKAKQISREAFGLSPVLAAAQPTDNTADDVLKMRFVLGSNTTAYLNNGVAVLASKNDPPIGNVSSARTHDGIKIAVEKHMRQAAQEEYDTAPLCLAELRQIVIWLCSVPEVAVGVKYTLEIGYLGTEVHSSDVFTHLDPYFLACERRILGRGAPNQDVELEIRATVADMRRVIETSPKREFGCILRALERMLDTNMYGPAFHVEEILTAVKKQADRVVKACQTDVTQVQRESAYLNLGDPDTVATWTTMAGYVGRRGPCQKANPNDPLLTYRFPDHIAPVNIKERPDTRNGVFAVADERPSGYNLFRGHDDIQAIDAFDNTFVNGEPSVAPSAAVRWMAQTMDGPDPMHIPTGEITNFYTLCVLLEHIISKSATNVYARIAADLQEASINTALTIVEVKAIQDALLDKRRICFSKIGSAKLRQLQSLQHVRCQIKLLNSAPVMKDIPTAANQHYTTPVILQTVPGTVDNSILVAREGPLAYESILRITGGPEYEELDGTTFVKVDDDAAIPQPTAHTPIGLDADYEPAVVIAPKAKNLYEVLQGHCLGANCLLDHVRLGVHLCHLRNPSEPDPAGYDPPPGPPVAEPDTRAERDRSFLWSEVLREVNIGADRLWMFVKVLSGAMGEPADSLLTLADENAQRAQRAFDVHKKEISDRVAEFHVKLIESVVGGILRSSKLEAIPDQHKHDATDALFVADAEMAKEIRSLAAGESGRPFFEANVAIQEILRAKNGKTVSMASLLSSLTPVVTHLNDTMQTELAGSYAGGMGLSGLSNPRNSFLVNLRNDVIACLRISLDRLHREMGSDRVSLWELVEGASSTLSLRFAELVAHVLQATRSSSGSSALYISAHMKANHVLQTRLALSRLVNECGPYITRSQPPNFQAINGRDAYFTAYRA